MSTKHENRTSNHHELNKGDFIAFPLIHYPEKKPRLEKAGAHAESYRIIDVLSKGPSFGISYQAKKYFGSRPAKEDDVFIKTPRISFSLPTSEIQRHLGIIFQSFTTEYLHKKIIARLNKPKKIAAETYDIGFYKIKDEAKNEITVPYLIQEFIVHEPLSKFIENKFKNKRIEDPKEWFKMAEKIIRIIRRVHNNQIIHGEIEPKNFLIKESKNKKDWDPILVDFGKSFLLDVSLARATAERARSPYVAPECRNHRDAYSTTADIYTLGGVLFFLSTGENPPDIEQWPKSALGVEKEWKDFSDEDVERWKDSIHEKFKANDGLMKQHEGIVKIIDKCLRPRPEDRYSSAHKLLQALDSITYSEANKKDPGEILEKMKEHIPKTKKLDPFFRNIISDKLELIQKDMEDMGRGHFEIYGEREDLIDTLVKYLSVLEIGDTYVTVTVPEYWTKDNLGINGRFLTVNKDLVRSGVHIRRLFLVSQDDLKEGSEAMKVLQAHYKALSDLKGLVVEVPSFDDELEHTQNGTIFVGVCPFSTQQELHEYQQASPHVAIWYRKKAKEMMSIIFSSRPKFDIKTGKQVGGQIVQVRFRRENKGVEYEIMKSFFKNRKGVQSISEFQKFFSKKA